MAVAGDRDVLGMLEHVRASVTTLGSGGVKPDDIVVPGGTHAGAFDTVLPQIFEFFAKHSKSTRACAHGDWELGETVASARRPDRSMGAPATNGPSWLNLAETRDSKTGAPFAAYLSRLLQQNLPITDFSGGRRRC